MQKPLAACVTATWITQVIWTPLKLMVFMALRLLYSQQINSKLD